MIADLRHIYAPLVEAMNPTGSAMAYKPRIAGAPAGIEMFREKGQRGVEKNVSSLRLAER